MDNDQVNPSQRNNQEEEYQFTDEEGAHKYESPASPSSVVGRNDDAGARRKKLILIIVGVIIGAFCLYKLYGLFTVEPSKTPLAPTMPAQTQTQAVVSPPVVAEPASPPVQPLLSEEKFDKENLKDKVSSLETTMLQNNQAQENLQKQIGGLSSAITEIQNNIAMLTQQINTIAQQKSDTETKVKDKEITQSETVHKTKEVSKSPRRFSSAYSHQKKRLNYADYYVRAMVQGRAWLISSRGATFTIGTGDQLAGYGQIQEIDPDKGIVMTSSGRVIGYMPKDR